MKYIFLLSLLVVGVCTSALEIPFSAVPVIDDKNLVQDFVRIDPDDQALPKLPTKAWLWYDTDNLYVRFLAQIDSTFIPGESVPRDYNTNGDLLRVQLTTMPEAYYAYAYLANPTGSLGDGIRDNELNISYKWDSTYSYTTSQDKNSWLVDMVIPFKDLRYTAHPPYSWKLILSRYHRADNEMYSFPYGTTKLGKDYYEQAFSISLTKKIGNYSNWRIRPYFVRSYDLVNKTTSFDPEHVGLDISFNAGTKAKVKVSLNPDFSDVPLDDAQDYYNSKYPPYYNDNRYFFIEDLDAFGVDNTLFYSRNIVQPQVAVKITGNSGTWTYGYLAAKDKKLIRDEVSISDDNTYQLVSVTKTLPTLEMTLASSSRLNDNYYNHIGLGNWDWEYISKFHIGGSHIVSIKHLKDKEQDYEENKTGTQNTLYLNASPGNWDLSTNYENVQKNLAVDMGRIWETGYEAYSSRAAWNADSKERYLRSWGLYASGGYNNLLNKEKSFNYAYVGTGISFDFLPQYEFSLNLTKNREAYNGQNFDQDAYQASFSWSKLQNFGLVFLQNQATP